MTTIHGDIKDCPPVELRTLKVGDSCTSSEHPQGRDGTWPATIERFEDEMTWFTDAECDLSTLLVHPLTRELLPDGTHRYWYVGSVRPIGELPVETEVRWAKDGDPVRFVGITTPGGGVCLLDDRGQCVIVLNATHPVRVIRYPATAAKGEAKVPTPGDVWASLLSDKWMIPPPPGFSPPTVADAIAFGIADLTRRVTALETAKAAAEPEPKVSQGTENIERLLKVAGAIDIETAKILVERTIQDTGLEDSYAVDTVVQAKPYLFATPAKPEPTYLSRLPEALQGIGLTEEQARKVWESRDATFVAGEPVVNLSLTMTKKGNSDQGVAVGTAEWCGERLITLGIDREPILIEDGEWCADSVVVPTAADALAFSRRTAAIALAGKGGAQ